ncbi:type II toxin-antitoxin system VapC family toxin [Rhizobium sp. 2YAF20]|uniref:type II toxin-antitoxin system VapC family toxin n=1 Tax=Rhizobium sp. 2YAF20 TaxID=3233027 RepID=UPI003F9C6CFB
MITHLLDTNAVIALLGRKSGALAERIMESDEGSIGLSAIVAYELYFGAYKSAKVSFNLETLRLVMADFPLVGFEREDAQLSGEIRADLAGKGTPIGPYDVLIAGQAKARDLILVTNNVAEFFRVDGLRVEDWTVPR